MKKTPARPSRGLLPTGLLCVVLSVGLAAGPAGARSLGGLTSRSAAIAAPAPELEAAPYDPPELEAEPVGFATPPPPVVPGDVDFWRQWGMDNTGQFVGAVPDADIDAPEAWAHHVGSLATVVAVVDTGVDTRHPDLLLNIWLNEREIPGYPKEPGLPKTGIYALLVDVDGDGIITFWDLNDAVNRGPDTIDDHDGNGFVDAGDVLRPLACTPTDGDAGADKNGNGIPDGEESEGPVEADCSRRGWADLVDSDANGYVDDLVGWDFHDGDNDPQDEHFHGTHAAGIIGAIGDGSAAGPGAAGVAGVNWRVSIMPLRIFPPEGGVRLPWQWKSAKDVEDFLAFRHRAAAALRYAVANGARVSNHSYAIYFPELDLPTWLSHLLPFVGDTASAWALAYELAQPSIVRPIREALDEAEAAGHLVVAAAGNGEVKPGNPFVADGVGDDLGEIPYYPASFDHPNLIAVAATGMNDRFMGFSNFGSEEVDLAAPGGGVFSTTPGFPTAAMLAENVHLDSDFVSGTSMAAPHVAGAAALLWDQNPTWSLEQVRDQILLMVDPLPDPEQAESLVTGGRLNLARAVAPGAWVRRLETLTSQGVSSSLGFADTCGPLPDVLGLRITFNEALVPAEFTTQDVALTVAASATVPEAATAVEVLDVLPVPGSGDRAFDVLLTPVSPGSWSFGSLTLQFDIGPHLLDTTGHSLDLDRDGADGEGLHDRIEVDIPIARGVEIAIDCDGLGGVADDLIVTDLDPVDGAVDLPGTGLGDLSALR